MDNEFEKQQPENEMPDMVESVPQNVEASAEVPQNTDTVGTVPQGNEELSKQSSNNYQQYNYQQNEQYDYGNTGYQTNYAQNSTQGQSEEDTRPLSMGEWLLTLLALCIPCCIGIALYIIWAFSKKGNVNRRNFCRAALIVLLVLGVIYFIMASILGGAMYSYFVSSGLGSF